MEKDFDRWNKIKKEKDNAKEPEFDMHVGQVWWCALGINVGSEQNGKGENFERPVVIIKKYTKNICLCVPTTTKYHDRDYYFRIELPDEEITFALLSQGRTIDKKRMIRLIGHITRKQLGQMIQKYKELI